ncbi:unnamed protein product [marine sediment metagenome]|uniref:Uncharacterized protein n=1 Tax=marine sediment metagenome TaxID=412755 RepID=X1CQE4_9ZZZZ
MSFTIVKIDEIFLPHIKAKTDIKQEDLMDSKDLANLITNLLELPRNMEVSEIIINRKKSK